MPTEQAVVPVVANLMAEYLTEDELCQFLRKNKRTLHRWNAARVGPPKIKKGRTVLYSVSAVKGWLEGKQKPARKVRRG